MLRTPGRRVNNPVDECGSRNRIAPVPAYPPKVRARIDRIAVNAVAPRNDELRRSLLRRIHNRRGESLEQYRSLLAPPYPSAVLVGRQ